MNEKKKIILTFCIGIAALIVVGIYSLLITNDYQKASEWVTHTENVLGEVGNILLDIQYAESAERGYVITGSDNFLESFQHELQKIENAYFKIKDLTKDNPTQQVLLDSFYHAIMLKNNRSKEICSIRQKQGSEPAIQMIKSGQGVILMDNVKTLSVEFINNENKLLTTRLSAAKQNLTFILSVIVGSMALAIIVALIVLYFFIAYYNKRLLAEKKLIEYKHFFNDTADFACIANVQYYFEVLNQNFEKILGYTERELLESQFLNFIHPDDIDSTLKEIEKLQTGAITINFVHRFRKKDGNYLWFDWNATPNPDTGKLYAIARDITEQKKTEEFLKNSLKEVSDYKYALNESSIVAITDTKGIIKQVNDNFCEISKYKREELIGKDHRIINSKFHPKAFFKELWDTISSGKIWRGLVKNKNKNGEYYWVDTTIVPFLDANNKPFQYLAVRFDVTEVKKAQDEIIKAKEAAEQSLILKETFLANMSHEIRTPMNAIIGFTDILLRKNWPEQEMDYLQSIKTAGGNLLTIINDILDISKIDAGMITFEEHPLNIQAVFKSLNVMLIHRAKNKKIDLVFRCNEDVPINLLGDPTRLSQIIINLVGNAIKFTTKGSVNVNAKTLKKENNQTFIEFSIQDTGIGIPEDKLEYIFERFRQAETHTTRQYGGTGLGLSIAKQLVELQGGAISVKSTVDVGSVFSFTIPFKEYTEQIVPKKNKEKKYKIDELRKLKILLVEDNPLNIKLVLSLFAEYELKTEIAENGQVAVEMIKSTNGSTPLTTSFDIVLMDMEMPIMNGYEATKFIRNELKNNIPIIAMTAHAMAGEREKCLSLGMNDYISKPINLELLFEKLSEHTKAGSTTEAETETTNKKKLVNFEYFSDLVGGKKDIMKELIDLFLKQLPEEMLILDSAIKNTDYVTIKNTAHKMKSSIAIFSIDILGDILQEMEVIATLAIDIEKLRQLNDRFRVLCKPVFEEIEKEKINYGDY